jgi:hypothetical protein
VPANGTESRLRSLAITMLVVAVALYFSVHLIVAIAPVLITIGAVVMIGAVIWQIVQRRRW